MSGPPPGKAGRPGLELTWLGAAGFRVRTGENVFLIDPFVSRNPRARPIQELKPGDIREGRQIFISHGHFDHIKDIPQIAASLGAKVFCHPTQARSLVRDGLAPRLIMMVEQDGQRFDFGSFSAQANYSRHIKFDLRLVLSTLARINLRLPGLLPLTRCYPPGQVLTWKFDLPGRSIRHLGSAGSTRKELAVLAEEETDILLLPLQGHTRICRIVLEFIWALRPKTVIPHHQDDFYPPISRMVDIGPFLEELNREFPQLEVITPRINQPIRL